MSTQQSQRPPEPDRTPEALIQELAARAVVPHFEDIIERHSGLYSTLCDAVVPEQDQTTTTDFCERCQSAYLRVDEERNAELVERERLWFKIGSEVGRRGAVPQISAEPEPESGGSTKAVTDLLQRGETLPTTTDDLNVDDTLITVIGRIWLAIATVHAEVGDVADVSEHAWLALADLLQQVAADLEAARTQYCREGNGKYAAAADERGAA